MLGPVGFLDTEQDLEKFQNFFSQNFEIKNMLASPQVAPTAQARNPMGSQGVCTAHWTGSYLLGLWYRYMNEPDNYHGGIFTRWIAALTAANCNDRVNPMSNKNRSDQNHLS